MKLFEGLAYFVKPPRLTLFALMFSLKELQELYNISYNTLRKYLADAGVLAKDAKVHRMLGYMELEPFFKIYGDRTGKLPTYFAPQPGAQLTLFAK